MGFGDFSIRVLPHTSYSDIGYFMVEGRVCLGALGFGLCFGLLYWFGGLLCFGIVCIDCWEVLCVLRDLRVEMLGGLRIEVKV